MIAHYEPTMYKGKVTVLQASQNEDVATWQKYCAEPLAIVPVGGDHFSVLREPHVRECALAILETIGLGG
jgi:thioesterase domain-containing protein